MSESIAKALSENTWGELTINGVQIAVYCPLCNALVAHTPGDSGRTGREQHTAWHIRLGA